MSLTGYRVFIGLKDSGKILEADVVGTDDGVAYEAGGKSNRLAPAGPRGECLFTAFGLTFQWFGGPHVILVRPHVDEREGVLSPAADGVSLLAQEITLPDAGLVDRMVATYEVPIIEVFRRGGQERFRNHVRGRWIQTEVLWTAAEQVIIDSCDVEYEIVREQQRPQGT